MQRIEDFGCYISLPDSDTTLSFCLRRPHLPFGYKSGESRYILRNLHDESRVYSELFLAHVTWGTQEIPHTIALDVSRTLRKLSLPISQLTGCPSLITSYSSPHVYASEHITPVRHCDWRSPRYESPLAHHITLTDEDL